MIEFVEKLKPNSFDSWKVENVERNSPDSPEPTWSHVKKKNNWAFSYWLFIALPISLFLIVGLYLIIVDVKVLTADLTGNQIYVESNVSSETLARSEEETVNLSRSDFKVTDEFVGKTGNATEVESIRSETEMERGDGGSEKDEEEEEEKEDEEEDEDPNLIVRFDYVDLSPDDFPADGRFVENAIVPKGNETGETLIILKNEDSGRKIFLKASAVSGGKQIQMWNGSVREKPETKESTTPKVFIYSPTIPQATSKKVNVDATTKKYNTTEDSGCFSTKLSFCEGILPYDVVQLPDILGVNRYKDLASVLPYFQMIIDSGCSLRAREFICSLLEPECRPEGLRQTLPCRLNCKVVSDDCKDFILQSLPLSRVFDCRRYPDFGENGDCINFSKEICYEEEFQCPDGSCVPLKWVCDGVHDCPGSKPSFDEANCQGCSENEFSCALDGKCIPLHWKCDGQIDCTDHSDESTC